MFTFTGSAYGWKAWDESIELIARHQSPFRRGEPPAGERSPAGSVNDRGLWRHLVPIVFLVPLIIDLRGMDHRRCRPVAGPRHRGFVASDYHGHEVRARILPAIIEDRLGRLLTG